MRYDSWAEMLPSNDPKRSFILNGVKSGFNIVEKGSNFEPVRLCNYKSATDPGIRDTVEAQIKEELANGQYIKVSQPPKIISSLGSIPKKGSAKRRLIHDCSRPIGQALNDYAVHNPFKYQSLQDAIDVIKKDSYLAKVDLSNAYRVVKIHPNNFEATGLAWTFTGQVEPTNLVDTRLPFGAKCSPEIFYELTQAVRRIMLSRNSCDIIAYLDDFLIVGETYNECLASMNDLVVVLRYLGFRINYNKMEMPTKCLTFLGIELNSENLTMSLPQEKITDLNVTLNEMYAKTKVTKRALQSLAGKLNWATQCIFGGRFHLRRILDRIVGLKKPWHRTRVTQDMKRDILWWLSFMQVFNGKMVMVDNRPCAPVCIDACTEGAGAYFNGECVYTNWFTDLPRAKELHINFKEVLALEPAVLKWCTLWQNKKIFVHCDNQAAVAIINKGSCRNPTVMESLRKIFWCSAIYNFRLKAVYYAGKYNQIADAVSRLHEHNSYSHLFNVLSCSYL